MTMKELREFLGEIIIAEDGKSLRIVSRDGEMKYKKIGKLWYFDGCCDY